MPRAYVVYGDGRFHSDRPYCWISGARMNRRAYRRYCLQDCEVCGAEYTRSRSDARTCSNACRQKAYRQRRAAGIPALVRMPAPVHPPEQGCACNACFRRYGSISKADVFTIADLTAISERLDAARACA